MRIPKGLDIPHANTLLIPVFPFPSSFFFLPLHPFLFGHCLIIFVGWIPTVDPSANKSYVIVRAANCPAEFGGSVDHLMLATCYSDGTCDDITEPLIFPFEESAEDPRLAYVDGWWYLFYFANGENQSTVYLRKYGALFFWLLLFCIYFRIYNLHIGHKLQLILHLGNVLEHHFRGTGFFFFFILPNSSCSALFYIPTHFLLPEMDVYYNLPLPPTTYFLANHLLFLA